LTVIISVQSVNQSVMGSLVATTHLLRLQCVSQIRN